MDLCLRWVGARVLCLLVGLCVLAPAGAGGEDVVRVYGPGGPLPAMLEAAEVFGRQHNMKVEVVAGPTDTWLERARVDADLIYSGSEYMMDDLVRAMGGQLDGTTVMSLYLRPSAILVRPGNPKRISGFSDLRGAGVRILVVAGAGQMGLWEDMAGKQGNIRTVRAFRKNIAASAANGAEAKKLWMENRNLNAWVTWNVWQTANPTLADLVPVGDDHVIYRSCVIARTKRGLDRASVTRFDAFLKSPDAAKIFGKRGWIVPMKMKPQK